MRKEKRLEELQFELDNIIQKNEQLRYAYRLLARECCRLRASLMAAGQSPAGDLSEAGSLAMEMNELNAYRPIPISNLSPIPRSHVDIAGTTDKLWSHWLSEAAWGV
ncbi:hypothetical protein CSPAE12_06203 [Colletotrichum incanum]|nr:hypothetical protein CSPAE12_06203 [Colletotrichum incanum]